MNAITKPTEQAYRELQTAYDHFNDRLFGGQLPPCLITLQRKDKRSYGYFSNNRFADRDNGTVDEIAMNPAFFHQRDQRNIVSTLVHEMVHLWQFHFGKPSRNHHNKQFAETMKSIGLQPSSTGQPGGKEIGQKLDHYVIDGGEYDVAYQELVESGFKLEYAERDMPEKAKKNSSNRVKYVCEECDCQVWGKPDLYIMCGDCEAPYLPEEG
jgi:predicted SprT family Zn-dependent metalloprotease